jgi:hypothetical protein
MTLILSLVYGFELFLCANAPNIPFDNRLLWEHRFLPHGALLSEPFGLRPAILVFWLGLYACIASLFMTLPGSIVVALNMVVSFLLAIFIILARFTLEHTYRQALKANHSSSEQELYRKILASCAQILVYAPAKTLMRLHQITHLSAHITPTAVENIVSVPSAQVLAADYLPQSAAWIPWSKLFHNVVFGHLTEQQAHLFRIADENEEQKSRLAVLAGERDALCLKLQNLERESARTRVARKAGALAAATGAPRRLTFSDYANLDTEELTKLQQEHSQALKMIQRVLDQNSEQPPGLFRGPPMGDPVSPLDGRQALTDGGVSALDTEP